MTFKKILIYLALVLPLCLSAQNYADYKLYASYDFEQGVIDRQANTSLELKNGARIVEDAVRGKVLYFSGEDVYKRQHCIVSLCSDLPSRKFVSRFLCRLYNHSVKLCSILVPGG